MGTTPRAAEVPRRPPGRLPRVQALRRCRRRRRRHVAGARLRRHGALATRAAVQARNQRQCPNAAVAAEARMARASPPSPTPTPCCSGREAPRSPRQRRTGAAPSAPRRAGARRASPHARTPSRAPRRGCRRESRHRRALDERASAPAARRDDPRARPARRHRGSRAHLARARHPVSMFRPRLGESLAGILSPCPVDPLSPYRGRGGGSRRLTRRGVVRPCPVEQGQGLGG